MWLGTRGSPGRAAKQAQHGPAACCFQCIPGRAMAAQAAPWRPAAHALVPGQPYLLLFMLGGAQGRSNSPMQPAHACSSLRSLQLGARTVVPLAASEPLLPTPKPPPTQSLTLHRLQNKEDSSSARRAVAHLEIHSKPVACTAPPPTAPPFLTPSTRAPP